MNDYVWDRNGEVDEFAADLEARLKSLSSSPDQIFVLPAQRELVLRRRPPRWRKLAISALLGLALLLLILALLP